MGANHIHHKINEHACQYSRKESDERSPGKAEQQVIHEHNQNPHDCRRRGRLQINSPDILPVTQKLTHGNDICYTADKRENNIRDQDGVNIQLRSCQEQQCQADQIGSQRYSGIHQSRSLMTDRLQNAP